MLTAEKYAEETLETIMNDEKLADSLPSSIRKKIDFWHSLLHDSDEVTDLGKSPQKGNKHVATSNNGSATCYCPKTKHIYKHVIKVPNKFALICRGCGKDIYDLRKKLCQ